MMPTVETAGFLLSLVLHHLWLGCAVALGLGTALCYAAPLERCHAPWTVNLRVAGRCPAAGDGPASRARSCSHDSRAPEPREDRAPGRRPHDAGPDPSLAVRRAGRQRFDVPRSPLGEARRFGHDVVVSLLLSRGASD